LPPSRKCADNSNHIINFLCLYHRITDQTSSLVETLQHYIRRTHHQSPVMTTQIGLRHIQSPSPPDVKTELDHKNGINMLPSTPGTDVQAPTPNPSPSATNTGTVPSPLKMSTKSPALSGMCVCEAFTHCIYKTSTRLNNRTTYLGVSTIREARAGSEETSHH
jgi:hypothetical protein